MERGEMGRMMFGSCVNGPGCVFVVKIELRTYGGVLV